MVRSERQSRTVQNRAICAMRRQQYLSTTTRLRGAAALAALFFALRPGTFEMPRHSAQTGSEPLHVSLVAIPEAVVSTLSGIFDVMNAFAMMPPPGHASFPAPPFRVEIVGLQPGLLELASHVPVKVQRSVT